MNSGRFWEDPNTVFDLAPFQTEFHEGVRLQDIPSTVFAWELIQTQFHERDRLRRIVNHTKL